MMKLVFDATKGPAFAPCSTCKAQTSGGGLCYECMRKRDARTDARHTSEGSIPKQFAWARFDNAEAMRQRGIPQPLIERARVSVGEHRMVFVGTSGRGKTTLAIASMRERIARGLCDGRALFMYAPDVSAARMRTKWGNESDLINDAVGCSLLVIDDMGGSNLPAGPLEEVIHKRHADGKATWVTTWMNSSKMVATFGDGVTRRVFEGARVIDFGGAK